MTSSRLSDRQAKNILLSWPKRSADLWPPPGGSGFWVQGQPRSESEPGPTLSAPGATMFRTQPDGMWAFFHDWRSCDVVVVEVCGTAQNLNDKRSRYIPASHSLVLTFSPNWLREEIPAPGRGRIPRWKAAGTLKSPGKGRTDNYVAAVRHLRVLYALPNDLYHKWCSEHVPTGYEFYCPHSSLGSYTSQKMQRFLRQLSIAAQFYTTPKRR
jgi:hypothetical protein